MHLVCMGWGYVAQEVVRCLPSATVWATHRGASCNVARGGDAGAVRLVSFVGGTGPEGVDATLAAAVRDATHILVSIPPDEDGCPAAMALAPHVAEAAHLEWAGYLSTTGVYGDRGGGWCFEEEPPTPQTLESAWRVAAEAQWHALSEVAHTFRLPGIYGPGRSALDRVRAGTAQRIAAPGHVFNRAHVGDIARLLVASMAKPKAGGHRVFNVADDEPAPGDAVICEAARLLGVDAPPSIGLDQVALPPFARAFYEECKRVSNARAKAALGWAPRFATYREGLAAIAAGALLGEDAS